MFPTGFRSHHNGRASSCTSRLRRSIPTNGAKQEQVDGSIRSFINRHQCQQQHRRSSAVLERSPKTKIKEMTSLNLHHCRNIQSSRRSNIVCEQKRIDRSEVSLFSSSHFSRHQINDPISQNRTEDILFGKEFEWKSKKLVFIITGKDHRQNTVVEGTFTFSSAQLLQSSVDQSKCLYLHFLLVVVHWVKTSLQTESMIRHSVLFHSMNLSENSELFPNEIFLFTHSDDPSSSVFETNIDRFFTANVQITLWRLEVFVATVRLDGIADR